MDFYAEPAFFVFLLPIVAIAALLGVCKRRLAGYGCVMSFLMLGLLFFRSATQLGFAAMYIVGSLTLYRWIRDVFDRERQNGDDAGASPRALACYRVALALQIAPLAIYKVGVVVKPDFPGFLGISYITFKAVQVLIELRDGLIDDMTLGEYAYFLAFFPTFTSGPILRSRTFVDNVRETPERDAYLERLYRGIGWFVMGVAYKFVGSALAKWALWFVPSVVGAGPVAWLAQVLFFGVDLFFDFAGYSNMAMGLGLALGIEVPRNFHMPFVATDIADFWNRWHISLSTWLRDFVFMRFSRFALERKLFSDRQVTASVGFALNMTLMGVWHGITPAYIAYGLYHGALLAGFNLLQKRWKFYKSHRRDRWFKLVSWAITMVAVFFGFALFGGYVI